MADTQTSYLSIGEVLGLLLEEFPDVTISKIRFLESQGLISPERTSSGYRKFYDEDVELLRVILTEQRLNYLPLRVIKDRLETGEIDPTGEHLRNNDTANDTAGNTATDTASNTVSDAVIDPTPAAPTGRVAAALEAPPSSFERVVDDDLAAAFATTTVHDGRAATTAGRAGGVVDATDSGDDTDGGYDEPVPATSVASHPASRAQPAAPEGRSIAATPQLLPGVLLDRAELCSMVGVTPSELEQLESFGVLAPNTRNGTPLYDDEAVAIAAPAVQFLRLGVDARHLRAFRTAAEREVGLYEQLITPRYRQRNPEARAEALDQLRTLNQLGGSLRAALTQHALRHHFES
ncbi:MAG TPA: MerR family transcriptional regulator [Ilumatobacter sp.]|nr:MerR family transcriptional regulator [Ilumatobacter sp.]